MGVGFVPTDRGDAKRAGRAVGAEHRTRDRLLLGGADVVAGNVEGGECARDLFDGRTTRGGSEDEMDERGDTPTEHDRSHDIGRLRPPEVHRRDREQEHDPLPHPSGRSCEIRRGDGDHRDRHRDAHQRELGDIRQVEGDRECVREIGLLDEPRDQTAHDPGQRASRRDVACQAPAVHEEQRESDEPERPQREEVVEDEDEAVGVVGQQAEEPGERPLGRGGVVRVEREQREENDRNDDPNRVTGSPARAFVGHTANECAVAVTDAREQGRSLAYLLAVTTLGRDDLVLTASSVGCPPFPTLIEAAVRGGFAGLSLWPPETYGAALEAGYRAEELRRMLDDAGLVAHDVDALVAWAGPGDPGEPYLSAAPRAFVLEAAAALGARQANAIIVGERGTSHEAIAEAVDAMCAEAAAVGVRVGIEFARGSLVRTIADLVAVRALLPHRDVGITVDAWQIHWGPSTLAELRAVPGAAVFSVQLDDAPAERPDDFGRADLLRAARAR